jgi:hypothetical protein
MIMEIKKAAKCGFGFLVQRNSTVFFPELARELKACFSVFLFFLVCVWCRVVCCLCVLLLGVVRVCVVCVVVQVAGCVVWCAAPVCVVVFF